MWCVTTIHAKNVPHLLKDRHSPFHSVFCIFSKIIFITVSYSLFNIMFNILHTSRITVVDSFLNKSPKKEAMRCKVWESEAKSHAQQCDYQRSPARKWLLFSQYEQSPHLAETAVPFILFQHSWDKEMNIFHSNRLFKEQ